MKSFLAATVIGAAAAKTLSFTEFTKKHGKKYASVEEHKLRSHIYAANVEKIRSHNAGNHTWKMAVNKFADLMPSEFKERMTGGFRAKEAKATNVVALPTANIPASVDWVSAGAVTPVKNQGQCGSCWSFSTTGSVEGITFISTGNLVSLSEQQLVDCSGAEGNNGCNGGLMDYAFQFIIDNNGITTEAAYPYTAAQGTCQTGMTPAATISSYNDIPANDDASFAAALATQPVSIAIEADQNCFQFYSSGVLDCPTCGTQLDHGVLAVGYGTDSASGNNYYKVKNSWGADWGMSGYVLLLRGGDSGASGECGILMSASVPVA